MLTDRQITGERVLVVLVCTLAVLACLYWARHEIRLLLVSLWHWYLGRLKARPLLTKCCTSLCGFGIGDTIAQRLLAAQRQDYVRTARFMLFGFLLHAPGCHFFYRLLDSSVLPRDPTCAQAVILKIFLDRVAFTPVNMTALFIFTGVLEGLSWRRILNTLRRRLLPMWLLSNTLWPAAHALNFAYVAPEQRVLFVNVVSILWNAVSCQMVGSEGTVHHSVMYGIQRLAEFHTKHKPKQDIL